MAKVSKEHGVILNEEEAAAWKRATEIWLADADRIRKNREREETFNKYAPYVAAAFFGAVLIGFIWVACSNLL